MADRNYRANLHGALAYAAAGLIAGALLVTTTGAFAWWLVAALSAVLLVLALAGVRRERSPQQTTQNANARSDLPAATRELMETIPDPLLLVDAAGRVVFANRPMQEFAGTDPLGKPIAAVLRFPAVLEAVGQAQETGESATAEFAERVPMERHYRAFATRAAQPPHLTAVLFHNLTALKRAEQARADFIANASHELRTPLAAVTGFIDTLRGHARDDEAARDRFLAIMSVEAQRMRRLIDDLLSLTRIELNEHVPPAGEVNLQGVVRDAAAALAPLAECDQIAVLIEAPNDLPPVRGDRDELIQVFQNLIHNGIKYGRPGGHVWLELAASADGPASARGSAPMVSVTVRDDGEGIPREAIPRLTERF
jgi:two-component system phosphate regulon sensor histidine kinase PhoR